MNLVIKLEISQVLHEISKNQCHTRYMSCVKESVSKMLLLLRAIDRLGFLKRCLYLDIKFDN